MYHFGHTPSQSNPRRSRKRRRVALPQQKKTVDKEKVEDFTYPTYTIRSPTKPIEGYHRVSIEEDSHSQDKGARIRLRPPSDEHYSYKNARIVPKRVFPSVRIPLPIRTWLDRWLDTSMPWRLFLLFIWLFSFVMYTLYFNIPLPLSKLVAGLLTDVSTRVVFIAWLIIGLIFSLLFFLLFKVVRKFDDLRWRSFFFVNTAIWSAFWLLVVWFASTSIYQFILIHLAIIIGSILRINIKSTMDLAINFVITSPTISFIVICTTIIANFIVFGTLIKNFIQKRMRKRQNGSSDQALENGEQAPSLPL